MSAQMMKVSLHAMMNVILIDDLCEIVPVLSCVIPYYVLFVICTSYHINI